MKKLFTFLFIFLLSQHVMSQSKEEQQVLQLAKAKFKWLIAKKLDSLDYVLDERLTFIHSNGWVQSKKELLADLKSNKLTYISIDVTEVAVRMYLKSAVLTGRGKFVASVNGNTPNPVELAFTETYVLQKKEWKLASRHASRIQ